MTHETRLRMRGIRKSFGATVALDGVDLAVRKGEVHALVGENGAGKSTLMKILSGALLSDAGTMEIDGTPYRPRNASEGRRAGVAMIYQELSLAPHMTVEDNIVLGVEPASWGITRRQETRSRARQALAVLGHETIQPDGRVGALSIAERQIVEIARALSTGCRVLVLDEPTSSLSIADIERLFSLIRRLTGQGVAVVYISHFLEEVKRVSDLFTVLRDGRTVGGGPTEPTDVGEIVRLMIGRQVSNLYPRSARAPGEELLDVNGLAGFPKPDAASFTVRRGEIFGIAGLVGAGRTELLRTLFGLAPVRQGTVRIGVHSGPASPARRWAQGAGFLSEDRGIEGLALSLSLTDNLTMGLRRGIRRFGLIRPSTLAATTHDWINRLGIRTRGPDQRAGALSGGNQQKLAFARLLHEEVDILLLDEPTRGVDVASKAQIYELMDRLATGDQAPGHAPRAILMVSSYLPELIGMCDRIAVMHRGRLGNPRPATSWTEHELMLEATGQGKAA